MIFLPGTFLAVSSNSPQYKSKRLPLARPFCHPDHTPANPTPNRQSVFSMSFFKWIPEDSNQVVSPYIVIYAALAIGLTYLIYSKFWMWKIWRVWGKKGKRPAGEGEV